MRLPALTQAIRALRRTPWFTATLAIVVALGISLSTTVFAIVDGALFKPLAYRGTDRLFSVSTGWSKLSEPFITFASVSPAELQQWQADLPDVQITAFYVGDSVTVGVHDYVRGAEVRATFFDVLGLAPMTGGFSPSDFQRTDAVRPAIIS